VTTLRTAVSPLFSRPPYFSLDRGFFCILDTFFPKSLYDFGNPKINRQTFRLLKSLAASWRIFLSSSVCPFGFMPYRSCQPKHVARRFPVPLTPPPTSNVFCSNSHRAFPLFVFFLPWRRPKSHSVDSTVILPLYIEKFLIS